MGNDKNKGRKARFLVATCRSMRRWTPRSECKNGIHGLHRFLKICLIGCPGGFSLFPIRVIRGSPQGLSQENAHVGPVDPEGVEELMGARGAGAGFAI